ncbi:MAG: dimethyl sulfoxide reductase anchor subunit [Eggerthellaceae bacterium]|jgi:anaerobic dimethyl sulfoxide reductase subunit C (anchor subunit)|nr:dimethyl sulfoxide reductase anchor subunit [Eggerthellaceae bacterium]
MVTGIDQGLAQLSLVAFTTLMPSGALAFVAIAALLLSRRLAPAEAARLARFLIIPLAVAMLGLIASTNHLGKPGNTLYVLMGVGRSPLSNEVFATGLFVAFAWTAWLLSFSERPWGRVRTVLLALSCASALAAIAFISCAYSIRTVVTWDLPFTNVNLVAVAPMGGSVLALATLRAAGVRRGRLERALLALGAAGVLLALGSQAAQCATLGSVRSGLVRASDLVGGYPVVIAASAVGATASLALAVVARRTPGRRGTALAWGACALMAAAVAAARFMFYAMHLTAGL